jgi:DMSO/TMAO reductase YedYZ molybdopterin-dependent catalytic subunit
MARPPLGEGGREHRRGGLAQPPTSRTTNLTLLLTLVLVFASGLGAVATGSPRGRWVVIAHGVAAIVVVLLIPWKSVVVRRGLRRRRPSRWVSLLLALLVVVTLSTGFVSATGAARSVAGLPVLWLHIAVALALVPLLLWHLVVRFPRPRRVDLSRRNALRLGLLAGVAAGAYAATEITVRLLRVPGARRRFTGSYQTGSFVPAQMPVTSWLDDRVPTIDPGTWRLVVVDGAGRRELTLDELSTSETHVRAILDCTSGWYAEQDWSGVRVGELIRSLGEHARSLYVHSVSGYWMRLPIDDLDGLLLATRLGGEPLRPGHGYPMRLVAPGRRGFWWVKWVDRIEVDSTPAWWQPPLPVT